jgi:hypothetical protein
MRICSFSCQELAQIAIDQNSVLSFTGLRNCCYSSVFAREIWQRSGKHLAEFWHEMVVGWMPVIISGIGIN